MELHQPNIARDPVLLGLKDLLGLMTNDRVLVLGTTCTGKSTLVKHVAGARDLDAEFFPLLSVDELARISQTPWTPEIGEEMNHLVNEKIASAVGKPLFGTVVVDADRIIFLEISESLLSQRAGKRDVDFGDALNMQSQLLMKIQNSNIPWVKYSVG